MVSKSLPNPPEARACLSVLARSLCSTSLLAPQVLCIAGLNRNRPICAPRLAITLNSVSKSNRFF